MRSTWKQEVVAVMGLFLMTTGHTAPLQQMCDGEPKTCCLAVGFSSVPPMWVNYSSCPKGMVDDSGCAPQYGCEPMKE
jgi:hypothetical protein